MALKIVTPYDPRIVYTIADPTVTIGGAAGAGSGNIYYSAPNAEMVMTFSIVDSEGVVQTQLDQTALGYPPVLKMPLVKIVGGSGGQEVDEVYFDVTIVEGVMTISGSLPASGNWKVLMDRVNTAIAVIDPTWRIDYSDVTFLA